MASNVRAVTPEKAEEVINLVTQENYIPDTPSEQFVGGYVGKSPLDELKLEATPEQIAEGFKTMAQINAICDAPDTPGMASVLREFMCDVEAAGIEELRESWPDLLVTYEMAKVALKPKQ